MWKNLNSFEQLYGVVRSAADLIRNGELGIGRPHYALTLLHGVLQSIMLDYKQIVAIEMGVQNGGGLIDLCKSAHYLSHQSGVGIQVYGFDNGVGLPKPNGYEDHPELWQEGDFKGSDFDQLPSTLPAFAHLIIGDVKQTVPRFKDRILGERIAMVALDRAGPSF